MIGAVIDKHRIVKRLMQAGFTGDQAETVTDSVVEAMTEARRGHAVISLAESQAKIASSMQVIADMRAEMKIDNPEILAWVTGIILVQLCVILTLVPFLPGAH